MQSKETATGSAAAAASDVSVDDFVVLKQEDAIEAMGYYIAMYISRMPEAKNMDPKQLQGALAMAFQVGVVMVQIRGVR